MDFLLELIRVALDQVLLSLVHNWPYLLLSVAIAAPLRLYVKSENVTRFLNRRRGAGVAAATAVAVGTPLCSCGTTAVVLGMMAGSLPWAPIVAFMVASPLTSPEGLVYTAGLFGWPFSIAFFAASIALGLLGGWIAAWLERRGWLENQNRLSAGGPASPAPVPAVRTFGLDAPIVALDPAAPICACPGRQPAVDPLRALARAPALVKAGELLRAMLGDGKRLLVMFVGFAFIGYFLNGLIPAEWVSNLFGGGNVYNVPLAATFGLPFYINSEASLPLVRALLDNGMSQGAALAFLIAGSGTSIGAISGALTIARWRVVGLVVSVLWAGAIMSGLAFDLLRALHTF
jgi:uncharacterized membrane protein YraQ (UPF0718 family)